MNQQLEEQLFNNFPLLYEKNDSIYISRNHFGFECGDGWYDIIRKLSEQLYPLVKNFPTEEDDYKPTVLQVKEKYGTLRVYMTYETDEMLELIAAAEVASEKTCEVCGLPGTLHEVRKWYYTRCQEHKPQ